MRKIYTLAITLLFAASTFAQVNVNLKKCTQCPIIDGTEETLWDGVDAVNMEKNLFTEAPDVTAAYWKATWNDTAIFVLMRIEDDDWYPAEESGGNDWEYDKDEIYFDLNDTLADGQGPMTAFSGHWQCAVAMFDSLQGVETYYDGNPGWAGHGPVHYHSWTLDGENTTQEWRIPANELFNKNYDTLGIQKSWDAGVLLGFDAYTIDRDEDMTARTRKVWQQDGNTEGDAHEAWESMDHSGTITATADLLPTAVNTPKVATIRVYPNPIADYINISADFDRVVITNVLGQEVMNLNQIKSKRLDVGNLSKGIYVVKVYKGEKFVGAAKVTKN